MIDMETRTKMERFCQNCQHSFTYHYWMDVGGAGFMTKNMFREEVLQCGHPAGKDASGENAYSCSHQRTDKGVCGKEGRLFARKPEAWPQ
jgi:hypothetical protein